MPISKTHKIDARYELVRSLGDGLSGEVLLVSDKDGQKALKFLKKVQLNVSREDALRNFKNEFEILKQLNHPHIARILDFGFDNHVQQYYFTSEFVAGQPMDKACEGQSLETTEKIVVQVLRALNYLHARGVYHLDIKPQNILVTTKDGTASVAKIIDFGLAGYASPRKRVGTPAYMAPEVIQGGVLDGRSDLYSLGVVLYRIFTGDNPLAAKSLKDTLDNHLHKVLQPASSVKPGLPEYWDHILKRLLEKSPSARYSQASLVIRDLNFLSGKQFEVETRDTKLSYIPDRGVLIGREAQWQSFTEAFTNVFLTDKPSELRVFIVEGCKGTGKSRLLSEIKYFSQLRNVPVITLRQFAFAEMRPYQFLLFVEEGELGQDGVNALLQELAAQRALIVWATEKAPQGWANAVVATLANYTLDELKKYLEAVTGLPKVPDKLVDEVFMRTQGNPLFTAEFVKVLLEKDLFYDASGKWDVSTFEDIGIDFARLDVPSTVEEFLSREFRSLSADRSGILVWLAVHGRSLTVEELAVLSGANPEEREKLINDMLVLQEKGILRRVNRELAYYFSNVLFQDVIRKTLSEENIRLIHDGLAKLFAGSTENLKNYLYHAGRGSDNAVAVKAMTELSEILFNDKEFAKAVDVLEKLRARAGLPHSALWRKVSLRLAEAYFESNRNDAAETLLTELRDHPACGKPSAGNDEYIHIQEKLVGLYFRLNKLDLAEEVICRCRALLAGSDRITDSLVFDNYWGHLKQKRGEVDEAERIFLETHAIWRNRLNDAERSNVTNNRLFDVYLFKKKYHKTVDICRESIAAIHGAGPSQHLARLFHVLGEVYYSLTSAGEDGVPEDCGDQCLESFNECIAISKRLNDYANLLRSYNGIGNLYLHKQDMEEALAYYQRALAIARKSGDLATAAIIAVNVSFCYKKLENWEDTYSHIIYALNTFENTPVKNNHTWLHIVYCLEALAEVYRHRNQYDKAHASLDRIDVVTAGRTYLKPYLFGKHLTRLKIYNEQSLNGDFLKELAVTRLAAVGANEKTELEEYLAGIGFHGETEAHAGVEI